VHAPAPGEVVAGPADRAGAHPLADQAQPRCSSVDLIILKLINSTLGARDPSRCSLPTGRRSV
jgi:hypothetical protein